MYISWYFEYFPKVFMTLSLFFNSIFIYLNVSDKKKTLGNYRYLLLSFSVFNTVYSIVEVVAPVALYGSNYILVVYLAGGPFYEYLRLGQLTVSIRCCCIALSYAILTIHFLYRYFALFNPLIIYKLTSKKGIFSMILFFISHGLIWLFVCEYLVPATDEVRETVRNQFLVLFDTNISKVPFFNLVFRSSDPKVVQRCWLGISIVALTSAASITLYCVLGYRIFKKLQDVDTISKNTRRLHHQLFLTLAIQTSIPTLISFLPCMFVWFIPFFGIYLGNYGNIAMIALSAFPFLDVLAIIVLLPVYRNRFITVTKGESSGGIRVVGGSSNL